MHGGRGYELFQTNGKIGWVMIWIKKSIASFFLALSFTGKGGRYRPRGGDVIELVEAGEGRGKCRKFLLWRQ